MSAEEDLQAIVKSEAKVDSADVDYLTPPPEEPGLGLEAAAGVKRYRKRPVEIEAAQWDGSAASASAIITWVIHHGGWAQYKCAVLDEDGMCTDREEDHVLIIETIEGTMAAKPGGYVIKGLAGEFYPHDPDPLWSKAYEPVEES